MAFLWTLIAPGLLFVCFLSYADLLEWRIAAIHFVFLAMMVALLVEAMIVRLRKIPFTCLVPVFYLVVRVGGFLE